MQLSKTGVSNYFRVPINLPLFTMAMPMMGTDSEIRLRPDTIDESLAVTAEIAAGGAVFFHDLTLHSSHPNQSGEERWVWIPTYRDANAEDNDYPWAVAAKVLRGKKLSESGFTRL